MKHCRNIAHGMHVHAKAHAPRMLFAALLVVAGMFIHDTAYAISDADYNRYKATSENFSRADRELNNVLERLKGRISDNDYKKLIEEQREWLDVGIGIESGFYMRSMPPEDAYALAMDNRTRRLVELYGGVPQPPRRPQEAVAPDTPQSREGNAASPPARENAPAAAQREAAAQEAAAQEAAATPQDAGRRNDPQNRDDRIVVTAEGSGTTRHEALRAAWNEAVRKGVGMYMASRTEVVDDAVIEEIAAYSRGQIDSWKMLSERKSENGWEVAIQAAIERDVLQESLPAQREVALDIGDDALARMQVASDKLQEQKKVFDISGRQRLFDFSDCLKYRSKLDSFVRDGKQTFYVLHVLDIDMEKFNVKKDALIKTLDRIATKKMNVKLKHYNNYEELKKFFEDQKYNPFAYTFDDLFSIKHNKSNYYYNINEPATYNIDVVNIIYNNIKEDYRNSINSIHIMRNMQNINTYIFDGLKNCSDFFPRYKLHFYINKGDESDAVRETDDYSIDFCYFTNRGLLLVGPFFTLNHVNLQPKLVYVQTFDIEDMEDLKNLKCGYSLEPLQKGNQ